VVVFILATFGEGDPTDNAGGLVEILRRWSQHEDSTKMNRLKNLQYCAFGLGNSNYKYYNKVVDNVDSWLSSMGATRLGLVGKGDEARSSVATDEDFMEWTDAILSAVGAKSHLKEIEFKYEPVIEVVETTVDQASVYLGERSAALLSNSSNTMISHRNPYGCPISDSKELYTDSDRNCLHTEFDLSSVPEVKYQAGDHLAVWPVNPENEVNRLMELLGLDENLRKAPIVLKVRKDSGSEHSNISLPSPTTRESTFKYYLEICGPVSPDVLRLLLQYAPSEKAKALLVKLIDSRVDFNSLVTSRYASIAKVMELADPRAKWEIPFGFFIERLRRLQPRYYSIASSPAVEPRKPAITAVVATKALSATSSSASPTEKMFGVATNYLLALKHSLHQEGQASHGLTYELDGPRGKLAGGKVFMHIRRSTFKLPANPNTPIIMVAAGTGIAPFRGFVQERARVAATGRHIGPMLLFFGCRGPQLDYLYREEWESMENMLGKGTFRIITAFSRQHEKKVYVQHRLEEQGELVNKLLQDDAHFYVCGSSDMARDVRGALVNLIMQWRHWDEKAADTYVRDDLKQAKRLQEDVWST
jgi:NADPH-ferrihemoprotein reductase